MRASRNAVLRRAGTRGTIAAETHISGAEGIYSSSEQERVVGAFLKRALSHPKGRPDRISITIEKIRSRPKMISSLAVTTVRCRTSREASEAVIRVLLCIGISPGAIRTALQVVRGAGMRGASLVRAGSGERTEPDRTRGIRAKRFGILAGASRALARKLSKKGINTAAVKEAVVLASKVASCPDVIAELCISDDPGYTTGYIASRRFGYLRVPLIKRKNGRSGGRVFFIRDDADSEEVISYIETEPVIISETAGCTGSFELDEILGDNL